MNPTHDEQPPFSAPGGGGQSAPPYRGAPGTQPAGQPATGAAQAPHYPADQAFTPGGGLAWVHISKRFTWQRRISALLWAVPIGLAGGFLVSRSGGALGALLWGVAVLLSVVLAWIVAELAYRSWGYAERADDLILSHGVFVKRLIVVPYGRMQFVDVTAGLLEQWMGVATVRMHTAAAATDAVIPGLPATEAAMLRDRLAQKGEERSMGL
ncbi:PH domain-containing protein [Actinomadura fulvescens]|uniref:YdbS-like PH domain-containing protein n=1 Tax=Actinomadura fulvescens TaxID=46160 RepID=A0ABP6CBF8_9ACTN